MEIIYRINGKVELSMFDYIQLMDDLPDNMAGTEKSPEAKHLFMMNQECEKLSQSPTQLFHHLVMKLLYLCRHTRQDIQTAVAFLFTRL